MDATRRERMDRIGQLQQMDVVSEPFVVGDVKVVKVVGVVTGYTSLRLAREGESGGPMNPESLARELRAELKRLEHEAALAEVAEEQADAAAKARSARALVGRLVAAGRIPARARVRVEWEGQKARRVLVQGRQEWVGEAAP